MLGMWKSELMTTKPAFKKAKPSLKIRGRKARWGRWGHRGRNIGRMHCFWHLEASFWNVPCQIPWELPQEFRANRYSTGITALGSWDRTPDPLRLQGLHLHVSPWPQDSSSQILAFSPTFFLLSQNYENIQGPTRGTFLPYPSLMSAKCLRLALGCFLWPRRCSTKKFSQQLINGNFIFQEKKELPQILFNFISPDSLPFHFLFDTESMVQMVKEGKLKLICPLRTRPCALQLCTVSTTLFCTPTLRSVFPGSYHCVHIFLIVQRMFLGISISIKKWKPKEIEHYIFQEKRKFIWKRQSQEYFRQFSNKIWGIPPPMTKL